jgi:hypothetical protein
MRSTTRETLASKLVVFAGMPRTGSTSLFHILGQHPAIFRPFRKEMGYFSFNQHKGEAWYLQAYANAADGQRCVDITPEYFFDAAAMERIRSYGRVQVVLGVRDPRSFAPSLHQEYGKRYAVPPLEKFVQHYSYSRGSASIEFELASGTIRTMLALYRAAFGERLLLYDFDAFAADPLSVLRSIETFIGVEPFFSEETFTNIIMNRGDRSARRWMSALLSAEPLIDAASRLLPPKVLHRLAAAVYRGSPGRADRVPVSPRMPALTLDFEEDRRFIDSLFQGRAVIDGAGRTLYPAGSR